MHFLSNSAHYALMGCWIYNAPQCLKCKIIECKVNEPGRVRSCRNNKEEKAQKVLNNLPHNQKFRNVINTGAIFAQTAFLFSLKYILLI